VIAWKVNCRRAQQLCNHVKRRISVAKPPMNKRYDFRGVESKWYQYWLDEGVFSASSDSPRKKFVIVIPPPNLTGILHMGHVLNNTIQDVIIRWKRMEGFETLWLPGIDHAGIATQNVVERYLEKQGRKRIAMGREAFLEEVWKWARTHEDIIIRQLKMLGCSCDWSRKRFTLDDSLSRAVREVFVKLYEKGLIYKGKYIINWCPHCRTALSDEEVEHRETGGHLYFMKYPLKGSQKTLTVATTRPETMLGDVAVAVNPADKRFASLKGKKAVLPFLKRELDIIQDDYVDPKFGTGAVKVTPAHDPNDFELGKRHELEFIVVISEDGTMNEKAGEFAGLNRYDCREKIIAALKERGLLAKVEKYTTSIGYCHRCGETVEPMLSDQWFVKMKPLAEPAARVAREGGIKFYPRRWMKVYLNWLDNIRDWCISRQLWWGHRIPVWYCDSCGEVFASVEDPQTCLHCQGANLRQEEDVLDTWFSSWLWPFSSLGWPEETDDYKAFYPTSVLVTAPDIIFFWVARMVMAGLEFTGKAPFSHIHLHGVVRDERGRRMSKSLGNSPDPIDIMEEFGADALRFTMLLLTPQGQDTLFDKARIETGRNFANKLWNAARLVLSHLGEYVPSPPEHSSSLSLVDRWIMSGLSHTVRETTRCLAGYRFNDAAKAIYEFAWHRYCDWYLELAKSRFFEGSSSVQFRTAMDISVTVLERILILLHPFMPFATEEIWSHLPARRRCLARTSWPKPDPSWEDEGIERNMSLIQQVIVSIRNLRAEMNVPPGKKVSVKVRASGEAVKTLVEYQEYMRTLGKVEELEIGPEVERPRVTTSAVVAGVEVFLPLEGLIDVEKESRRLMKEIDKLAQQLMLTEKKLRNEDFLKKARREVVEKERRKAAELLGNKQKLEKNLHALQDS